MEAHPRRRGVPVVTVGEQTLARLEARLNELRGDLAVETDRGWRVSLHSQIRDVQYRIDQVFTWVDSPMGRAEVTS